MNDVTFTLLLNSVQSDVQTNRLGLVESPDIWSCEAVVSTYEPQRRSLIIIIANFASDQRFHRQTETKCQKDKPQRWGTRISL